MTVEDNEKLLYSRFPTLKLSTNPYVEGLQKSDLLELIELGVEQGRKQGLEEALSALNNYKSPAAAGAYGAGISLGLAEARFIVGALL